MSTSDVVKMDNKINDITVIHNSIQGENREHNQDDILILCDYNFYLFILFDGVGSLSESWDFVQLCKHFVKDNHSEYICNDKDNLKELIFQMHKASCDFNLDGKSTCSALLLKPGNTKASIVSIGDSRVYSFGKSYMEVLTTDDQLPGCNSCLTKYIGQKRLILGDIAQIKVDANQNFLICSDGFYSLMENDLKHYFKVFHYKRNKNIINAINNLQVNINRDDSTYIIVKNERI